MVTSMQLKSMLFVDPGNYLCLEIQDRNKKEMPCQWHLLNRAQQESICVSEPLWVCALRHQIDTEDDCNDAVVCAACNNPTAGSGGALFYYYYYYYYPYHYYYYYFWVRGKNNVVNQSDSDASC